MLNIKNVTKGTVQSNVVTRKVFNLESMFAMTLGSNFEHVMLQFIRLKTDDLQCVSK
jgi:hypothetical protein